MKLTKIYTRTGDKGETSIVGGIRVAKNSVRLEAYGTVDELSSHLGLLVSILHNDNDHNKEFGPLTETLQKIQNNLFNISTILATDVEALKDTEGAWVKPYLDNLEATSKGLENNETPLLEEEIDKMNEEMEPLNSFILSGGSMAAAQCHVCRTVCRRAERRVTDLKATNLNPQKYLNRLSDYLFVLARKINIIYGVEEKTWQNSCT